MTTIRLTPSGHLALDLAEADAYPVAQDLAARFATDWREGLLCLCARRDGLTFLGAAHFWADVAARFRPPSAISSKAKPFPNPQHAKSLTGMGRERSAHAQR